MSANKTIGTVRAVAITTDVEEISTELYLTADLPLAKLKNRMESSCRALRDSILSIAKIEKDKADAAKRQYDMSKGGKR